MNTETHTIEEQTDLVIQPEVVSFYHDKEKFEHVQRVAKMFSASDMVPKRYLNNVGNCVIALEIAHRMGASPLMVMQHLYIVHGTPGWSSVFLIATLNASGKFSPLRYEEEENKEGGRTRAWAIDKFTNEKVFGAWVSMEMAKAEGWIDKNGSKWKTMPELMRRYRAASFFTKQFAPEISMGFQTAEELADIAPAKITPVTSEDKEAERMRLLIADCKTVEEVQQLQEQAPDFDANIFNSRIEEIRASEGKK